jgi:hypothetical protein
MSSCDGVDGKWSIIGQILLISTQDEDVLTHFGPWIGALDCQSVQHHSSLEVNRAVKHMDDVGQPIRTNPYQQDVPWQRDRCQGCRHDLGYFGHVNTEEPTVCCRIDLEKLAGSGLVDLA